MRVAVLLGAATLAAGAVGADAAPTAQPPPIVFASNRADRDLVVVRQDGRQRRLIVAGARDEAVPSWSPDGTRVAFSRYDGHRERAAVLDLRTRRVRDVGYGYNPDWSPDGKRLVFLDAEGFDDLVTMRADGSNRHRLKLKRTGIADETDPSWSPRGDRIAFGGNGLYTVRPNGSGLRRLRREGRIGRASWSPNGQRIAFDCAVRRSSICVVNADGSKLRKVTNLGQGPAWSRRGNVIASTADENSVVLVRPSGKLVRRIRALVAPSWSPDGRLIGAWEPDSTRLYATNATGRSLARLTNPALGGDAGPAWSPDGRMLAFRRKSRRGCALAVTDVASHKIRTLVAGTQTVGCLGRPDWSPDRARIVYESGGDLWSINARGGRPQRLTATPSPELNPRFAPDGRSIAFVSRGGGIWLLRPNGERTLLVPGGLSFAWSHDGTMLAYLAWSSEREQSDLYLRTPDGAARKLVEGVDDTPTWSSDDRRIASIQYGEGSGSIPTLLVIDLAGNVSEILDEASQPDWRPR